MNYLERAIAIAVKYHRNQRDSEGMPKIIHSLSVMYNMEEENEKIVAVLHDVIEDTGYTLERLKKEGFSEEVLNSLDCITHRDKESYSRYIERVKTDAVAIRVKLSDLSHNMDIRRMNGIKDDQMARYIRKYKPVWEGLIVIESIVDNRKGEFDPNKNFSNNHYLSKAIYRYIKRRRRMNLLEKAISIAVKAHENQVDKGGTPYILHPLYVMLKMDTENEKIAAVLHDVVEDSEYDLEFLKREGFPDEILSAVDCLTRKEGEDYKDYIVRVALNPISAKIKIADLEHNMDLKRFKEITDEDVSRIIKKYKPAWDRLKKI